MSAFPGVFVTSAYANQLTFGVEHQLPWQMVVAADYASIKSRDNPRTVNVNHPIDGVCPYLASCAAVNVNVNNGRINSDALQLQARRRFGGSFGMLVSYTFLNAKEDGPSTSPYLRDPDYGPTPNDVHHRFSSAVQAKLPFEINSSVVVTVASKFPYNETAGIDTTGDRVVGTDRPPGVSYNSLRADGFFATDLRLGRTFSFGSRVKLDVMWEMFNMFNTVNYNNFVGAVLSPFYRQPTQALAPFQGQLGARLNF